MVDGWMGTEEGGRKGERGASHDFVGSKFGAGFSWEILLSHVLLIAVTWWCSVDGLSGLESPGWPQSHGWHSGGDGWKAIQFISELLHQVFPTA